MDLKHTYDLIPIGLNRFLAKDPQKSLSYPLASFARRRLMAENSILSPNSCETPMTNLFSGNYLRCDRTLLAFVRWYCCRTVRVWTIILVNHLAELHRIFALEMTILSFQVSGVLLLFIE